MIKRQTRGFTLIELLVAVALMTFLIGVVVKVFAESSKTVRETEARMSIFQNGRVAISKIADDLAGARGSTGNNFIVNDVSSTDWDNPPAEGVVLMEFNGLAYGYSTASTNITREPARIRYRLVRAPAEETPGFTMWRLFRDSAAFTSTGATPAFDPADSDDYEALLCEYISSTSFTDTTPLLTVAVPGSSLPYSATSPPGSVTVEMGICDDGQRAVRVFHREFFIVTN